LTEPRDPILYKDAGVDIDAGDTFVSRIRSAVDGTRTPRVLGAVEAYQEDLKANRRPVGKG